jgi:hypothetical protein
MSTTQQYSSSIAAVKQQERRECAGTLARRISIVKQQSSSKASGDQTQHKVNDKKGDGDELTRGRMSKLLQIMLSNASKKLKY